MDDGCVHCLSGEQLVLVSKVLVGEYLSSLIYDILPCPPTPLSPSLLPSPLAPAGVNGQQQRPRLRRYLLRRELRVVERAVGRDDCPRERDGGRRLARVAAALQPVPLHRRARGQQRSGCVVLSTTKLLSQFEGTTAAGARMWSTEQQAHTSLYIEALVTVRWRYRHKSTAAGSRTRSTELRVHRFSPLVPE